MLYSTGFWEYLFRMSLKELLECKHPTAWIEFEKGLINEVHFKLYDIQLIVIITITHAG